MEELKLIAEIGWMLVVISPFFWRFVFDKWDE